MLKLQPLLRPAAFVTMTRGLKQRPRVTQTRIIHLEHRSS